MTPFTGQRGPAHHPQGGAGIVEIPDSGVETVLIDLANVPIAALVDYDLDVLGPSLSAVMAQVDRPRKNIGSGPPGRAD
jgi:hypothetical protein